DSLLEIISVTQCSSVTKVRLHNCELITDDGFDYLQYLEYLDAMNCRIRDQEIYHTVPELELILTETVGIGNLDEMDGQSPNLLISLFPELKKRIGGYITRLFWQTLVGFQGLLFLFLMCGFNLIICAYRITIDKDGLNWLYKYLYELTHLSLNKILIKNESLSTIRKSTFANRKLKYHDVGYTRVTDKEVRELR
ncbi:32908_t:CDS:2, partial [Gigaspora margarita]